MIVCRTLSEFDEARQRLTGRVGFVPTMGAIHRGHLSLIQTSWRQNDHTVASIFVNPTQFNDPNDFERYPRDEKTDLVMLEAEGVEIVFLPTPQLLYPDGYATYVVVEGLTDVLEGAHRPGHFRGVATVVTKLLNIVQPDATYLGQKDAQQVAVIKRITQDLHMRTKIVACPTIRESDGLALSSRNALLNPDERIAARVLYKALNHAESIYDDGERDPNTLREALHTILSKEPLAQTEYASVADFTSLQELDAPSEDPILMSLAVKIGTTRLIDNFILISP